MHCFDWNGQKNELLRHEKGVAFEEVIFSIMHDELLDTIEHPNSDKYSNQKIFIVNIENYIFLVPFVESEESIFLNTIIPSRKMTKKYLGGK